MMTPEKLPPKHGAEDETEDLADITKYDHPPAYNTLSQDPTPAPAISAAADPLAKLNCKPTNFLYVDERDGAIKGTYVIDPKLHIPDAYLPPLNTGEKRKNVYLHTRDGSVDVDLWIVGRKDLETPHSEKAPHPMSRTNMHVSSRDGSVAVKVNAIDNIHPFSLEAASRDGRVTVLIPRSFHGPLVLKSKHGNCALSDGVLGNSIQLGTVDYTKRFFVGDLSAVTTSGSGSGSDSVLGTDFGSTEWAGDELRAETRDGRVKVKYVDEVESADAKRGFFDRLFRG
ncbi:hypothetical protein V8B97DRAFT_835660 [Scleroderma yunnanense]